MQQKTQNVKHAIQQQLIYKIVYQVLKHFKFIKPDLFCRNKHPRDYYKIMKKPQNEMHRVSLKSPIYKRQKVATHNALNKSTGNIQRSKHQSIGGNAKGKQKNIIDHQAKADEIIKQLSNKLTPRITNRALNSNDQPTFQKVCCPNCRYLFRVLMAQAYSSNSKTQFKEIQKNVKVLEHRVSASPKKLQSQIAEKVEQFTQTYEKYLEESRHRQLPSNIETVKINTVKTPPVKNISIFQISNRFKEGKSKQLGKKIDQKDSAITFQPSKFEKSRQKKSIEAKGQIKTQSKKNPQPKQINQKTNADRNDKLIKQIIVHQVIGRQRQRQIKQIIENVDKQHIPSYVKMLIFEASCNQNQNHNPQF